MGRVMLYCPASASHDTVPLTPLGTMILCSPDSVSGPVPSTSPPATASPTAAVGVKDHSFSRSSGGTWMPRVMLAPTRRTISSNGRWMPS